VPDEPYGSPWERHDQRSARQGFRSAATRARLVTGLLVGMMVVDALSLIQDVAGIRLVDRLIEGSATMEEAEAYDTQVAAFAAVWLAIFVPTVIAFLAWLSRAVANGPALGAGFPPSSPRAAIGWWFVPIANLFKPYQIVKDLHQRLALPGSQAGKMFPVLAWWLIWIGGNLVDQASSWLYLRGDTTEALRNATVLSAVGYALSIIAAGLAILVVRAIQARENEWAARLTTASAPPA
jgi:hypothetical protein